MDNQDEPLYAGNSLTVLIRDDAPMIHCGDSPSYRTVQVPLEQWQIDRLELKKTGSCGTTAIYEAVSRCIIETKG